MKKNLKIAKKEELAKQNNKGITLIALVITIVVLLILAGITINAVLSEGGIFNTAKNAENVQQHASVKEKVQVMLADAQLEKMVNNKTLKAYLEEQGYTVTEDETAGTVKVVVDGYEATINQDTLEITKIEKFIPIAVAGMSLSKTRQAILQGEELILTATVTPENASNKRITWTSSNPQVATVNNGIVESLTEGNTTITATTVDGSFAATCDVIVKAEGVISIETDQELKNLQTTLENTNVENIYVVISNDINLNNEEWTSIESPLSKKIVIYGNENSIIGLSAPFYIDNNQNELSIYDLTIENSNMTITNPDGGGSFFECIMKEGKVILSNCHLKNSTLTTENNGTYDSRIGGLIGANMPSNSLESNYVYIEKCSVTGCTLKAYGSIGGIIAHVASGENNITNCIIENNTLISTDDGSWRVGVVVGTANTGELTISNITESGNTLTQDFSSNTPPVEEKRNYYGRFVPNGTGKLVIDGTEIQQ